MTFSVFFSFDGNCKEALEFYAGVFGQPVNNLMTYAQSPPMPGYTLAEADRDRIMYASMNICGCEVMFMDMPAGEPAVVKGNQVCVAIESKDREEVERYFGGLAQGGVIAMELQKTFWSELNGMVADKFGIHWNVCQSAPKA